MASNELKSIHANAKKLLALVQQYGEQGDLEAWQQSKITKAADYLNSVLQSIGGEQDALGELKGDPSQPDPKKVSNFQSLLQKQRDRFNQQGFARAADDTQKLQKKFKEPVTELDKPSGTMFLKFAKKQLPDKESQLYGYAGFGSNLKDVVANNAKIKPFIINTFDDLEYNIEKILRDVDFVGTEKIVIVVPDWLPDNIMGDLDALVQIDDRLEFYEKDPDDDEGDRDSGKILKVDPVTGRRIKLKPDTPKAQVGGSSHDTPVQPQTFKYTLQQTDLIPKLRSMGFKFNGNQIVLSKQQRDQLVQKLGDKFQSIFGKAEKFTEGVAGPKNCWPGHRKVGTKPGTGKNAGKRVNDCEKIKETDVDESGLQYHTGVKKHGEKYMRMAAAAGRRGASQEELGRLKDRYSKAYKKENVDVGEAKKPAMNFDIEDIKRLEQIKDLATLKAQAFSLISKPSAKPMKP
ncbi:MAG: hypothetical protein EBX47_11835, partial [Synechococcaceae bacterium WB8_1B_057]|nr:hypothetical protein [Synechococcaceae bacterium WB8_1B_057]